MGNEKEIVRPFYEKCLTVNTGTDVAALMNSILADDFQSMGGMDMKGKAALMGQIQYFWKMVPDLKWEIQEMLQDGNRVIVRSMASGSPKGDFMGLTLDGSKSFNVMTIDIHTVEGGQIKQVYHIEDWAGAMKQLRD